MDNFRKSVCCAMVNFRKWHHSPTMYAVWAVMLLFAWYTHGDLTRFCMETNMTISPWVLPFYIDSGNYMIMYVGMVILLFAAAPFADLQSPFVQIRTGRLNWFWGQVLYILLTAMVFPLMIYASQLLILAPAVRWSTDWGGVIRSLAQDASLPRKYGLQVALHFPNQVIQKCEAIPLTVQTLSLMMVNTAMIGFIILLFNVTVHKIGGVCAACALLSWSAMTSHGIGIMLFTEAIRKYAVCLWLNPQWLAPLSKGCFTIPQVLTIQLTLLPVMIAISAAVFYRKDTVFEKGRF